MATYKLILERGRVYVRYTCNRQKIVVSTGVQITPEDWNAEKGTIRKAHPSASQLQQIIDNYYGQVLDAVSRVISAGRFPSVDRVRQEYLKGPVKDSVDTSQQFWEWKGPYLEYKRVRVTPGSLKNFRHTFTVMKDFEKECRYKFSPDLNRQQFDKFVSYMLTKRTLGDPTVHRHVRALKTFLRWAYPDRNWNFIRHEWIKSEDVIFLYEDELQKLIDIECIERLSRVRDLFVFGCTTGMRYSDVQRFRPEWLDKNGLISYTMLKNRAKAFIPLYQVTSRIINKYNGKLPVISDQKFNKYLKELFLLTELNRPVVLTKFIGKEMHQEVVPLSQLASSHLARRTFVSLALMNGIPIQDVMRMSGHADFKSMKPYIAITNAHLIEVAKKWKI